MGIEEHAVKMEEDQLVVKMDIEHQAIKTEGIMTAPKAPFPFMRLPPEIRNMVYKELLVMPAMIAIGIGWSEGRSIIVEKVRLEDDEESDFEIDQKATRKLLHTSKTIYQEASHFYWGSNHLYFEDLDMLTEYLQRLRPDFRRLITHVTVRYIGRAPARAMKALSGCISLRKLTLDISFMTIYQTRITSAGLMTLTGMNDLLKLRGLEKVNLDTTRLDSGLKTAAWLSQGMSNVVDAIQVLKKPHDPARLKRQEAKDYPKGKSQRTVFGKANVITRTERKVMGEQKNTNV